MMCTIPPEGATSFCNAGAILDWYMTTYIDPHGNQIWVLGKRS